jgi:hypothetical protein
LNYGAFDPSTGRLESAYGDEDSRAALATDDPIFDTAETLVPSTHVRYV